MLFVGYCAVGAVIVYACFIFIDTMFFGLYAAVAVECFPVYFANTVIIETKVHACAKIAVEFLHIMALLVFGIKWAKVRMCNLHIVEIKIGDQFIFGEMLQALYDLFMFFCMLLEPFRIGQFLSSLAGLSSLFPISSKNVVA